MCPLNIAYVICIKVPLTLNFKILTFQIFFFIFMSDLLQCISKQNSMYARWSDYFSGRRRALERCACFGKMKFFSVVIGGNPMKLLQYDVIINTAFGRKYTEKF